MKILDYSILGVAVALGSDFNPNAYCMSMVSYSWITILVTSHDKIIPQITQIRYYAYLQIFA